MACAVDFHRIVALLLVDIEHEPVRTKMLPELPLDVTLQVLVTLLLVRKVVAYVVVWRTLVLHRGLCCSSLLHKL